MKCIWLGRGVDLRDKYSIEVFENDKVLKLLSDKIFEINELDIGSYSYDDALKKYYCSENLDLNNIIRARYGKNLTKEIFNTSEFFKNTNNYKFADILTIYCKEVTAHTTIEVEDNYSFRDFNINVGEIDTLDAVPFWIYEKTKLELPVYSIDYKGERYNFNFDVKTGGAGDRTFYERKKNKDKESQSWKEWEWDRMAMPEHAWDLPRLLKIKKQSW